MTTTRDVARRAGVSVGTASAVLNRNKFVGDELVLLVQQTIDELGHRLNLLARSLQSRHTRAIGIIIPNIMVRESCGCPSGRPTPGEVAPLAVTRPPSADRCIYGEEERCEG